MRHVVPEVRAGGAEVVLVGNGTPEEAREFLAFLGMDAPTFCDPGLASYGAAGFHRSVLRMLDPRALANVVRATRGGFRQGRRRGDNLQLGGLIALAPGDEVLFHHADRNPGDPLPVREAMAALAARAKG